MIHNVEQKVRENLLILTILVLIGGVIVGHVFENTVNEYRDHIKHAILILAISTIYPSMIKLRLDKLTHSLRKWKEIVLGLILSLLVAPIIAMMIAPIIDNPLIQLGYLTANIVPASSASIGYVLLSEGNIELATALVVLSIAGSIALGPIYLSLYSSQRHIYIPLSRIISSLTMALIVPLIAGQVTRYYLLKKRGKAFVERTIRPYLSLATMTCMLLLIFLLIMSKASLVFDRPFITLDIIAGQIIIMAILITSTLLLSKFLKIPYKDHVSLIYISMTKNQSAAVIIAAYALKGASTLPPAIIPVIQPVICILYIHMRNYVERLLQSTL
ncbi:MAG: hypothetical protein DRJ66_06150 [Thermoprotei archaeon]|nr:MAG: hypothetical protein DRJ66_06150 [Thermoprotei archaeon]